MDLSAMLARWEEAQQRGEELGAEQLCPGRPDLSPELQRGIEALRNVRQMLTTLPETLPPVAATLPPETRPPVEQTLVPATKAPSDETLSHAGGAAATSCPPGYEILGELGRGGMGVVYKARQVALNRVVALKMILHGGHASTEDRSRFLTEAEAIAAVRDGGVVQVYDYGTHEGLPYFTLEFCPGGSLAGRLNGVPVSGQEAARLVEQVAGGVRAAHERGIVHRDLKPANVLLGEDGTLKVTDFGLAKKLDEQGQTVTGSVMGTPSYMAPEQAQGKKDVGPLADVYALGAILYDCLTGRPPFRAATAYETLRQAVGEEPVAPRSLNPAVPSDLETICLKCLHKNPARRYASAAELADDLRRWREGEPILARPVGAVERAVKWARRRPAAASLVAVSAIAAVALVVLSVVAVTSWRKATEALAAEKEAVARKEEARRQAEAAQQAAGDVLNSAVGVLTTGDQRLSRFPEFEEFRSAGFAKVNRAIESALQKVPDDPSISKAFLELSIAEAWNTHNLGKMEAALPAYQRAERILAKLIETKPELDLELRRSFVLSNMGWVCADMDDNERSLKYNQEALALRRRLVKENPDHPECLRQLAVSLGNLGNLYSSMGETEKAERLLHETIPIQERLIQRQPDVLWHSLNLSSTVNNLAELHQNRKEYDKAKQYKQRTYDVRKQTLARRKERAETSKEIVLSVYQHKFAAACLEYAALVLEADGDAARSGELLAEGLPIVEELATRSPKNEQYRVLWAAGLRTSGEARRRAGKPGEAAVPLAKAVEVLASAEASPAVRMERARCRVEQARAAVAVPSAEAAALAFAVVGEVTQEYRQPKQADVYRELLVSALSALGEVGPRGKAFVARLAELGRAWRDDEVVRRAADEAAKRLGG